MSAWHVFNPDTSQAIPEVAACYVVQADGEVYVGSTDNLRRRLAGHKVRIARYSDNVETPWGFFRKVIVKYRPSRKYGDWAMVELRLIRRLQPSLNTLGIREVVYGR